MCVCECVCVHVCMHVHVNKLVYFKFLYCQGNSRSTDILHLNRPVGYVAMVTQCIINIHLCYLQDDPLLSDWTTDCVIMTPPLTDYVIMCAHMFVTNNKLYYSC